MKCPKCSSSNIYRTSSDSVLCRDCLNVFELKVTQEENTLKGVDQQKKKIKFLRLNKAEILILAFFGIFVLIPGSIWWIKWSAGSELRERERERVSFYAEIQKSIPMIEVKNHEDLSDLGYSVAIRLSSLRVILATTMVQSTMVFEREFMSGAESFSEFVDLHDDLDSEYYNEPENNAYIFRDFINPSRTMFVQTAVPKWSGMPAILGAVVYDKTTGEQPNPDNTDAIVCISDQEPTELPGLPTLVNGELRCANGSTSYRE